MNPAILRDIKIFAGVGDEHLKTIAAHARELSVPAGACVVAQGDYATDLMAILEGEAEVLRDDKPIATLEAGDSFGEVGVIERVQRNATVVAMTPMRLITLTGWDVKRMGLDVWFEIQDQMGQREVTRA